MTSSLSIGQVSAATGFNVSTLRYYDEQGLVPPAGRTAAGYRQYDQTVIARLAFISRMKGLDCTIEEMAGLLVAWDGGECGPLQDELRSLVAAKLTQVGLRRSELDTLGIDLTRAADALEQHRPSGACNESCGCIQPVATAAPFRLTLAHSADGAEGAAIACTLQSADALDGQVGAWRALLAHAESRTELDGGLRIEFDSTVPTADLMQLVMAEQSCCSFFRFSVRVDSEGVALEVRAAPEGLDLVRSLFG